MSEHRCGPPYPLKAVGRCLCCAESVHDVYQVLDQPGHPLDGHPVRIGPQTALATQVEFLLSDGSEADITFCRPCADALRPAHYIEVWRACVERGDLSLRLAGRSENARLVAKARGLAQWPVGILRRRLAVEDGQLVVDRRSG